VLDMSNREERRARKRAHRTGNTSGPWAGAGFRVDPQTIPGAITDPAELDTILEETAVEGRALLSDHPAVGLGGLSLNRSINMGVVSQDSNDEPLPVMLLEPRKMVVLTNPSDGSSFEAQVAAIRERGFLEWGYPVARFTEVASWTLRRVNGGTELRDSEGELWARAELTPDPAWVSVAVSLGSVLAVYGFDLGVRPQHGQTQEAFTDAARKAELREARQKGLVAAAIVTWGG
jgi:hypothetical protein